MSNEENNKEMKELLKQAIAPVKNAELRRDLWPQMLRKLNELRFGRFFWFFPM